jgi:hypothetical protein
MVATAGISKPRSQRTVERSLELQSQGRTVAFYSARLMLTGLALTWALPFLTLAGVGQLDVQNPSAAFEAAPLAEGAEQQVDVVIYGGTSAGVAAAVQVARMGHSVIVIEPTDHLGGLTTSGLGFTDSGDKRVIGGIAREFYRRIRKHYDQPDAWTQEQPVDYPRYRPDEDAMWIFEPHVAEAIFEQFIKEYSIPVVRGELLNRSEGVKTEGRRIISIAMESGRTFSARQFIDATYEGDLLAAAGVRYVVGREASSVYGEQLNGNQVKGNTSSHRFLKEVEPWRIAGDPASGLLPGIDVSGPGIDGVGDLRVQAYCFRMCMSNSPDNQRPFPKPEGYSEADYELLFRNFEAGDLRFPLKPDRMPNRKTDTNNNYAVSTDYIGANYAYPEATYLERAAIVRDHRRYQQGLMWTLANHPRVPESIRREMAQWGLPLDEFQDNDNWPYQLYVREARRMVSDYVMTELDCRRERVISDPVGMGSYNMDSHNVRRFVTEKGFVQNEGDIQVSPGGAYQISLRSIIPARGQVENLSVPVCLSASHIAYGSIRMEPVFMILGQSAATAAVQALKAQLPLQQLDYRELRQQLLADGQVLEPPPREQSGQGVKPEHLPGLVLDNGAAQFQGDWTASASIGKFVGEGYLHDRAEEKGRKSALFVVNVKQTGDYSLRLSYSAYPNRTSKLRVRLSWGNNRQEVQVDQRQPPPIDGLFVELARLALAKDEILEVKMETAGTDGHVIVDAIQLLPLEKQMERCQSLPVQRDQSFAAARRNLAVADGDWTRRQAGRGRDNRITHDVLGWSPP